MTWVQEVQEYQGSLLIQKDLVLLFVLFGRDTLEHQVGKHLFLPSTLDYQKGQGYLPELHLGFQAGL